MSVNYKQYLASREWAVLKRQVRERSGGRCERHKASECPWTFRFIHEATAVHHLTYERVGKEALEDLQHVCRDCHEFLSAESDHDPVAHVWASHEGDKYCVFCGATKDTTGEILRDSYGQPYEIYSPTVEAK